ncbi:MAG: hypothetical protein N4A44_04500 [Alphaproteobacteria bacterium]|jgi:hypothetical protein|nr:hypothetical protein [Alphaproteobacteria bacterium]
MNVDRNILFEEDVFIKADYENLQEIYDKIDENYNLLEVLKGSFYS